MPQRKIAAILLAGGRSRRMGGGDKCLMRLGGRSLLDRAVERLAPQVDCLRLNAVGSAERFGPLDEPLLPDAVEGGLGPLAGVLAGLEWARDYPWLAVAATDAPFFPLDLIERLQAAAVTARAPIAFASSCGRIHPVFSLWRTGQAAPLRRAFVEMGEHKVRRYLQTQGTVEVEWPCAEPDPFFNINTPEDLALAEEHLSGT